MFLIISFAFSAIGQSPSTVADSKVLAPPVKVNRTLPQVEPPKTALEFSAHPTPQELFRAHVFEEPLVPVGGEPGAAENAGLAAALLGYSKRSGPDDFSSLTGFLEKHPQSPWRASLLTDLGLEYYNTAYYSLALEAWREAWSLGQKATDARGKFLADQAVCELAGIYSRLGRMNELEALLKSVEQRRFIGGATERINIAREALSMMQYRPEVSFRCGPLALQSIKRSLNPQGPGDMEIFNSASTQQGFSLPQVAELSKKVGLNYQMAFRASATPPKQPLTPSLSPSDGERVSEGRERGAFIVPSVVHWKVGHYAAIVQQVGDRYLVQDPTFGNTVWATRQALEAETSGYFLLPPGELLRGWRSVDAQEGGTIWGKGVTAGNDADCYTPDDEQTGICGLGDDGYGMAVSRVHLMLANLQIKDTPVGYTPSVGPPVPFTVRYNHRDYLQTDVRSNPFGPKWTHDWKASIVDNPSSPLADVKFHVGGGGVRRFTGFDTNTQTFAPQQYDQSRLKRIGTNTSATYEMTLSDGSKKVFAQSDGSIGTSRNIFLTQVVDPQGNAVTLTYDAFLRLVALTDALGQVTTLTYGVPATHYSDFDMPADPGKLTKVTDPFGRFAIFDYAPTTNDWDYTVTAVCPIPVIAAQPVRVWWLQSITDVLGLASQFTYLNTNTVFACATCPTNVASTRCVTNKYSVDFVVSLTTPYGQNSFTAAQGGGETRTTRSLETVYADGSRERVEYNQSDNLGVGNNEPNSILPQGMNMHNTWLYARNTFYWSRNACAQGYGDYSKAKIYHWLHAANLLTTAGILESTKEALERRVWYDYVGQPGAYGVGSTDKPRHVGRVLDDGTTQLYTYGYNGFGNLTNSIDPIGRELSYIYATNGIDLLEVRQTRGTNNELLSLATYNNQHRPLTVTDAAGQTTIFTYNSRGQPLTETNPKGETSAYTYDANGYVIMVDGSLPGTNDVGSATYDAFGRTRTLTDESGYTLTLGYDALNRLTNIMYPDATFSQYTYNRLDPVVIRDRAGRQTLLEYDNMRQATKLTDPLNRVTRFQWCSCGSLSSLTDPMGRTTTWNRDLQGRLTSKQYGDGSQIHYTYENASSRLRQVIDEKLQGTAFTYNRDDTLKSVAYANATVPTPSVNYTYDPDYQRLASRADGTGITLYSYNPITVTPALGAGELASVDGPLPDDTITYDYDELGRRVSTAVNGVASKMTYDAAGRVVSETNVLGMFTSVYDGPAYRMLTNLFPNGQTVDLGYANNLGDQELLRITHKAGGTPISEFIYGRDIAADRITTWSQKTATQSPRLHNFGYDAANQLLAASVTNSGILVDTFSYSYDPAGNRLTEQVGASNYTAAYNALNQISTSTQSGASRTNEWDAEDRLVAVNAGSQRTEFTYDDVSRLASIRRLTNGVEASFRRFLWCGGRICEERDAGGSVTKRFFGQGMKVESGPQAGTYFYTRDHLGSIRELTDGSGTVRARYTYDPYGRQTKLTGDLEADFGFAGMFWSAEVKLNLTHYRAYDPALGRWLSRDPLENAEMMEGPNLYAYVGNNPVNNVDPAGLQRTTVDAWAAQHCAQNPTLCAEVLGTSATGGAVAQRAGALAPIAQNAPIAARCATSFSTLPQRIVELEIRYQELAPSLGKNYREWLEVRKLLDSRLSNVPLWTVDMIKLDRKFYDLAERIAARMGITLDQAWALLANRVGFNPETW